MYSGVPRGEDIFWWGGVGDGMIEIERSRAWLEYWLTFLWLFLNENDDLIGVRSTRFIEEEEN